MFFCPFIASLNCHARRIQNKKVNCAGITHDLNEGETYYAVYLTYHKFYPGTFGHELVNSTWE